MESPFNPYQSPQQSGSVPVYAGAPLERSISWRRGIVAALVAGSAAVAILMAFFTVALLDFDGPSPWEFLLSSEWIEALLVFSLLGYPFFLLTGMPALASYAPATRRGMGRLIVPHFLLLTLGFLLMSVSDDVLPERADGSVFALTELMSFSPMLLWGIFTTLRQINLDRKALGQ